MIYQAWRRDPLDGPTEYRSRIVFENATVDMVKICRSLEVGGIDDKEGSDDDDGDDDE